MKLNQALLRRRGGLLTVAVAALAACAPQPTAHQPTAQQRAALRAGRDAMLPCQERFHEESQTYADCVRYVAQAASRAARGTAQDGDWRRLGALYVGWVRADLVGQQGDVPADRAARQLLAEALELQARLKVEQAPLCELAGLPCATLRNRQQELASPAANGGH